MNNNIDPIDSIDSDIATQFLPYDTQSSITDNTNNADISIIDECQYFQQYKDTIDKADNIKKNAKDKLANYLSKKGYNVDETILKIENNTFECNVEQKEYHESSARKTFNFVKKCHAKYWWINAIIRLLTIAIFIFMIYKLINKTKIKPINTLDFSETSSLRY